jgi:LPS export ABC transporter protein LptC
MIYKNWKINLLLLVQIFILENCGKSVSKIEEKNEVFKKIPDVILYDFTYKFTKNDKIIWILYSNKADVFNDEKIIKVDGVHLVFYKNNVEDTILDSKFGEVDQNKNILVAISNVVLKTVQNDFLYTDYLYWDDKTAKLYNTNYVKIARKSGDVIEGIGFEADNNLEKIIIKKSVKGKIYETK